jgi:endonuclease/exonuclease/phosphatase family metal-dependent hydrolase
MMTEMEYASDSKNALLSVLLCAKRHGNQVGKNFIISTYHMPCRYKYKIFLCSHIHALKVHLDELTTLWNTYYHNVVSTVFCGDFNITPKSPEYKYLVGIEYSKQEYPENGLCNSDNEHVTPYFINDLADAYQQVGQNLFAGMQFKSTHKTLHAKEPDYTNVSVKKDGTFVECLDYILINNHVDIRSCTVGLNVKDPIASSYPNGLCPSDHLPVSASLRIQ